MAVSPTWALDVSHIHVRRASYSIVGGARPFQVSLTCTVATTSSPTEFTAVTSPSTMTSEAKVSSAKVIVALEPREIEGIINATTAKAIQDVRTIDPFIFYPPCIFSSALITYRVIHETDVDGRQLDPPKVLETAR